MSFDPKRVEIGDYICFDVRSENVPRTFRVAGLGMNPDNEITADVRLYEWYAEVDKFDVSYGCSLEREDHPWRFADVGFYERGGAHKELAKAIAKNKVGDMRDLRQLVLA